MDISRRNLCVGGMAAVLCGPNAAAAGAATTVAGGQAFGSAWRLVSDLRDPSAAARRIAGVVKAVDHTMSPYRATSPLCRFNRSGPGEKTELPPAMAHVAKAALAMARWTDGAFDPTMGPATARFGFGPISGVAGGLETLELRGQILRKARSGATLDLCGIAKGFALDRATEMLIGAGARDFLLEIGGEIRAVGYHPDGRDWHVAIADPFANDFHPRHIVAPGVLALATSGHVENGLIGSGPRLSHVIDPRTLRPAMGQAASVSVLAATGLEADALSTALLAMGQAGPEFARSHRISALFVIGNDAPGQSVMTGEFANHVLS